MKDISIYKNKIKLNKMNNRKLKKKPKKPKKPKNLHVQTQCIFSLNNLGVSQSSILEIVPQMLFCSFLIKGMHKVEQNYTHIHTHTNPTKCPKFKCNTVSVSFSACRCNSIVLSSKVGRKREKK
jgi:hypothetical protein